VEPERLIDPSTLSRAQAGDPAARGHLVASFGPSVWSVCRRLDHDPEDAYQAIWERVFVALERFDAGGEGSLRGWVLTVARRMLVDRHRRRGVRDNVVHLDEVAVQPMVEETLDGRSRQDRLEAALARLPEPQRRVVVLHHLQGISLEELARDEGVAVGTIKSRLHRGRARLLTLLEGT
jgi:RNA polymerase sigma-70 factor (ECF subfamily)